jgi:hypothetical protein
MTGYGRPYFYEINQITSEEEEEKEKKNDYEPTTTTTTNLVNDSFDENTVWSTIRQSRYFQ